MTLCKFRPQRTYDAQFILERNDAIGLTKALEAAVAEKGEDGLSATPYYVGAKLAVDALLWDAEDGGEVDMWTDFMAAFDKALRELEGGD